MTEEYDWESKHDPQEQDIADAEAREDDPDDYSLWCPACRARVHEDAIICPSCGEYITPTDEPGVSTKQLLAVIVVVLLIVAFLYWVI